MDIKEIISQQYGIPCLPKRTSEAMAYVPFQQFDSPTYSPLQGLESGTMFPVLNKPFYGKKCEREILLKKISTYEFAALDLQIYLDTHPHDTAMIQKMNGFKEKLKPLVEEYEEKFGPLKKSMTSTNMWSWIKGPWPWENEEDC